MAMFCFQRALIGVVVQGKPKDITHLGGPTTDTHHIEEGHIQSFLSQENAVTLQESLDWSRQRIGFGFSGFGLFGRCGRHMGDGMGWRTVFLGWLKGKPKGNT